MSIIIFEINYLDLFIFRKYHLKMEIKNIITAIHTVYKSDQKIADLISTESDRINQCVVYKWRTGANKNASKNSRYIRALELYKKLKRYKKIK